MAALISRPQDMKVLPQIAQNELKINSNTLSLAFQGDRLVDFKKVICDLSQPWFMT